MKSKKLFVQLATLLFAILLICGLSVTAYAAKNQFDNFSLPEKETYFMDKSTTSWNWAVPGFSKSNIKNLKSSNTKVATVSVFTYEGTTYIGVEPKKNGKTTVTFTLKKGSKSASFKSVVTIRKYSNPFQTLKIGNTDLTKKLAKNMHYDSNKNLSGKLTVKVKSGWKIFEIITYNPKDGSNFKSLKNGKTVKITKSSCVDILLINSKGDILPVSIRR